MGRPDGVRYPVTAQFESGMQYSPRQETHEELVARVAEERADLTCHVGPGGRPCGKPASDPIHTEAAP